MKLTFVLIVSYAVLCKAKDDAKSHPCKFLYRCEIIDEPTWSTDGKQCYVFLNPCNFANENCHRLNRNESMLEIIPKEQCKTICNSTQCPDIKKVVCGMRFEEAHEFPNQCLLDLYICKTEKPFFIQHDSPCLTKIERN